MLGWVFIKKYLILRRLKVDAANTIFKHKQIKEVLSLFYPYIL